MQQLELFEAIGRAYIQSCGDDVHNAEIYAAVRSHCGLEVDRDDECAPVGASGAIHNIFERKVRWIQQTMKRLGILEHAPGKRGVWRLTPAGKKKLSPALPKTVMVGFSTRLGIALWASCDDVFPSIDEPITLCLTSPPYPLAKPRSYGGPTRAEYVDFICKCLEPIVRNLVPGGSVALNVSPNIFEANSPARSLYCEHLVIALCDRLGLKLLDRLIWDNPAKPPGPVLWASVARVQLNSTYETIYLLTNNTSKCKADNRRVLQAHTERHLKLIRAGGESRSATFGDGAYTLRAGTSFSKQTTGKIPRNILRYAHPCPSQIRLNREARRLGLPLHGATMPAALARFLIEFLTETGDLVVDFAAGTLTTAAESESLGRRWLACELMGEFIALGASRMRDADGFELSPELGLALPTLQRSN